MDTINELLDIAELRLNEDQFQIAANICTKILKSAKSDRAKFILSCSLSKLGRHDDAIELSKQLAISPKGISNLALIYANAGQNDKATNEYRKAIKRNDCDPAIHGNYALHLKNIGNIDECLGYLKYISKEIPNSDSIWYTYGSVNSSLNKFTEAKDCYLKSIKINPAPLTRYDLSLTYFQLGEYKEGWKHYESRWQACWLFERMRNEVPGKFWEGENLEGKRILLWSEQGIGDLIHFYRYIKELEKMGAIVHIKYNDPIFPNKALNLMPYNTKYFWGNSTGFGDNTLDQYDYNCSVLTVAGILGADVKTTNGHAYLRSSLPALPKDNEKKIGLCWCGNSGHPRDKERSIKLSEFNLNKSAKVYSLVKNYLPKQYEDGSVVDWSEGYKNSIIDISPYLKDLNHTAQIIEWLDVVVTVDTVVAHLAGALGKKTYMLLPFNCDWRWWSSNGYTTPWYDSITIIKQEKSGNWNREIEKLKEKLWM